MKIFLNPGHAPNGIPDPGAVNETCNVRESDIAAEVAGKVKYYLENVGIDAEVFQHDDLNVICNRANNSGADLFVSIHGNSSCNPWANGTETYCNPENPDGMRLAECIQKQITENLGTADRGVKDGMWLYVVKNTTMTSILVELAFISNYSDVRKLVEFTDDFARCIARGVTDYNLK